MAAAFPVEYEPRLVEAAVLAAVRRRNQEAIFLRDRDGPYETEDLEARETAFAALHTRWFEQLALDGPLRVALGERPEIPGGCAGGLIVRAVVASDEGADLRVTPDALPTLLVCARAETLSRPERFLDLLRHELLHVADMLDRRFGYAPTIGDAVSPAHERLLRDRYRVLWDVYVTGRLVRLGHAAVEVRSERSRDFARAFPRLGSRTEAAFKRFFDASVCTHRDLADFAERPDDGPAATGRCPLCGLPAPALEPGAARLAAGVLTAIEADFAAWRPADGVCGRCAELYQQRASP
jgi:hypothetical protein